MLTDSGAPSGGVAPGMDGSEAVFLEGEAGTGSGSGQTPASFDGRMRVRAAASVH